MSVDAVTAPPRVGCDVVDVDRLARTLARRPDLRARVFTARERADALRGGVEEGSTVEVARLAARWAAKEAIRKALGDLRLPFHASEVVTAQDGEPVLHLDGEPDGLSCSLSHDGGVAMAVVIVARAVHDRHHRSTDNHDQESAHAAR